MASIHPVRWTTGKGEERTAWRVSYWVAGRKRFKQFPTERLAKRFTERLETVKDREIREVEAGKGARVGEVCERWLAACERGRNGHYPLEPQTIVFYRGHLDRYILPQLSTLPAGKLGRDKLKEFRDWILDEAPSRTQAQKVFRTLKTVIGYALEEGELVHDPRSGVQIRNRKRFKQATVSDMRIHTEAEMRTILETAAELRASSNKRLSKTWTQYEVALQLLVYCGLRSSELRGLPRSAVDLDAGTVVVRQRADRTGLIGPPKSAAGYRTLYMPTGLTALLKRWFETTRGRNVDLVFATAGGEPLNHANLRKRLWLEIQKQAKVRPLNFHSMRHFFASRLIDAGCSLKLLSKRMGHSDEAFTVATYGHLFQDQKHLEEERRMINRLVLA